MVNIAHDLFLLMNTLSQLKNSDRVITLFCEAISSFHPGFSIAYIEGEAPSDIETMEIGTAKSEFGSLAIHGNPQTVALEFAVLMQNAVQMLAVLLEKLQQDKLLSDEKLALRALADDRTVALSKSEKKYRTLLENLPQRIFYKDTDSVYISCNEHFARELKISPSEIAGKTDFDFFPTDLAEQYRSEDRRLMRSGRSEEREEKYIVAGSEFWIQKVKTPVRDESGNVVGIQGIFWDISERKQVEAALRDSEQFSRSVVDNSPLGISVCSSNGQLLSANQAWKRIWSVSEESYHEYLAAESARFEFDLKDGYLGDWRDQVAKVYQQGGTLHIPELSLSKYREAEPRWVSQTFYAIMGIKGEVDRVVILTTDITERRRADQALQRSEEKYRSLYIKTPAMQHSIDENGLLVSVSNKWLEVLGYEAGEVIGRKSTEFLTEESRQYAIAVVLPEYYKNGFVSDVLYQFVKKNGDIIDVLLSAISETSTDGTVVRSLATLIDVTERLKAEQALRDSEEKYRNLAETSQDLIWKCDGAGIFTYLNLAWEKTHGYSLDEMLGRPFTDFQLPEVAERDVREFGRHLAGGSISGYETTQITKSGETIHLVFNAVPLFDSDNEIIGTQGTAHDITERKRADKALLQSEEKFRSLAENSLDFILRFDRQGRHLYKNPAALKVARQSEDQVLGKTHREIGYEEQTCLLWEKNLPLVFGTGVPVQYVYEWESPRGKIFLEWRLFPESDHDGAINSVLAVGRDITETRRLQEQESRSQRLETAGQIAGQVAHDFNNLLAPLMAYPDFIRDELTPNHPALPYLNDIENSAQQIADINQQLLTLGRRGHYNQEPLALNGIILQVMKEFKPLPETLVCELHLADDLLNIKGGRSQIHRVISNLIRNAQDAVENIGQITVRSENYYIDDVSIDYGRVPRGEYVKLTISDTGCGIPDEVVQKIFDPFFTSKTTDKKRGSGLGLSVVDSVVRDHSGFVDLRTKVGEGTSFFIYFPITRDTIKGEEAGVATGGKEKILVVDDDDIQRDVSGRLLTKLGYHVSAVQSGEAAIKFLKDNPQDLLLLDMVMPPGINGTETYRRVLEIRPNQKAIIVSGFSETEQVSLAQELGAGGFVKKPLTQRSIAAAVRNELDQRTTAQT